MDQSIDPIVRVALSDHVRAAASCPLARFVPGGASRWPQERRKPRGRSGRTHAAIQRVHRSVGDAAHATAVEAEWNDPRAALAAGNPEGADVAACASREW